MARRPEEPNSPKNKGHHVQHSFDVAVDSTLDVSKGSLPQQPLSPLSPCGAFESEPLPPPPPPPKPPKIDSPPKKVGRLSRIISFWERKDAGSHAKIEEKSERRNRILWPKDISSLETSVVMDLLDLMKENGHNPKRLRDIFHSRELKKLLKHMRDVLKTYPNVIKISLPTYSNIRLCIVGDTHGQYYDLLNIFHINGYPSATNWYLFNGDFVDRGSWGVENAIALFALKLLHPLHVHLTRGNHETTSCNRIYGFQQEVMVKYNLDILNSFQDTFCYLPLAAIVVPEESPASRPRSISVRTPDQLKPEFDGSRVANGTGIFVIHGGLFQRPDGHLGTIRDLLTVDRSDHDPEQNMIEHALWSDPQELGGHAFNSARRCGTLFGPDITKKFLDLHGLSLVLRSHEGPDARKKRPHMRNDMMTGFAVDQTDLNGEPLLVTLFSAPDYPQGPKHYNNEAAIMIVHFVRETVPLADAKAAQQTTAQRKSLARSRKILPPLNHKNSLSMIGTDLDVPDIAVEPARPATPRKKAPLSTLDTSQDNTESVEIKVSMIVRVEQTTTTTVSATTTIAPTPTPTPPISTPAPTPTTPTSTTSTPTSPTPTATTPNPTATAAIISTVETTETTKMDNVTITSANTGGSTEPEQKADIESKIRVMRRRSSESCMTIEEAKEAWKKRGAQENLMDTVRESVWRNARLATHSLIKLKYSVVRFGAVPKPTSGVRHDDDGDLTDKEA